MLPRHSTRSHWWCQEKIIFPEQSHLANAKKGTRRQEMYSLTALMVEVVMLSGQCTKATGLSRSNLTLIGKPLKWMDCLFWPVPASSPFLVPTSRSHGINAPNTTLEYAMHSKQQLLVCSRSWKRKVLSQSNASHQYLSMLASVSQAIAA